ncbi:MAG: hypothetical protein ACK2T7_00645 [Anaerolineales bacterium]
MKSKTFLIWLVITLAVLALSVFYFSRQAIICWDGLEVDEPLLQELCGISREEYFSGDFNPDDCPESEEAVHMIGGCETDWSSALGMTFFLMVFYLLASGVFFFIRWLVRRSKKTE